MGIFIKHWMRRKRKLVVLLSLTSIVVLTLHFGYLQQLWIPRLKILVNHRGDIEVGERTTEKSIIKPCLSGTVFARTATGRLGNRLMEYASAWALAKLYNATPVVTDDILKKISPLFMNLSVATATKFLAELSEDNAICAEFAKKRLIHGTLTSVEPWEGQKIKELLSREPVVLRPYIILAHPISTVINELKEEFTYRPVLLRDADRTLQKAASVFGGNATKEPEQQIVYVGVHVRRTDYHSYLTRKFGVNKHEYASTDYYIRAVDYLLKRISEEGSFKVVFAVVSDDKGWCTKVLIPVLKDHLKLQEKNTTVQWCGSPNPQNDLVILSSCDHSIISYGTFAVWGALMAGGWTVVYDINPRGKTGKMNGAMSYASLLPNWITMH